MSSSSSEKTSEEPTGDSPKRADVADSISSAHTGPTLRRTFFKTSLATIAAIVGIGGTTSSVAGEEGIEYKEGANHEEIADIIDEWEIELDETLSVKGAVSNTEDNPSAAHFHRFIRGQNPELVKYQEYKQDTEFLVFTMSGPNGESEFGLGRDGEEFYYSPETLEEGVRVRDQLRQRAKDDGLAPSSDEGFHSSDCNPGCEDYPNSCGSDCEEHHCCIPYGEEEDICSVLWGACGSWDSITTACCCNCRTCYDLRIDCCGGHTWCPDSGCTSPHPSNC